jgi:flagellar biosynthesis component FlhA
MPIMFVMCAFGGVAYFIRYAITRRRKRKEKRKQRKDQQREVDQIEEEEQIAEMPMDGCMPYQVNIGK